MSRTGKTAVLLCIAGTLMILAGVVFARFYPLTPTSDPVSSGTLHFSSVRELIVISGTLPITVELTDSDICEVSYMSDLPLITSVDEQGTLRLTQNDSFSLSLLSLRRSGFHLTVRLPRIKYRRIRLEASSGAVSCAAVDCDALEISSRSGNITLAEADDRAKIRTESGALSLSLTALDEDMTITAGRGDVRLTLPEELSCCLKFLTESGSLIRPDKEPEKGDRAIVRNGGRRVLTVTTTTGSLILDYS